MIKDIVDQRFTVTKEYPGSKASLSYMPGLNCYMMKVEGQKVTSGMVHRAKLDFGVEIAQEHLAFEKSQQFIVTFPEG